jgi:predicted DNA-binding transcriptional regulator AlpA
MPHAKTAAAQAREANELRQRLGYITEQSLASLLRVALGTLRNRASAGQLPPTYKLGREKVYKLVEVEAWIARQRVSRAA